MERWPIMSGKRLIGHLYNISIDFISMEIYSFCLLGCAWPNKRYIASGVWPTNKQ